MGFKYKRDRKTVAREIIHVGVTTMNLSSSHCQYLLVVVGIVAVTFVTGCQRQGDVFGVTTGGFSWLDKLNETDRMPGIDEGTVSIIKLQAGPPEGVAFVIWSDLPNGRFDDGESTADGASYEGYQKSSNGKRIGFSAKTTDGITGSLNIGEIEYQLKNDEVFLISTTQRPPVIERIKLDLSKFPKSQDGISEYVKANQEIQKFFENLNVKKPTEEK